MPFAVRAAPHGTCRRHKDHYTVYNLCPGPTGGYSPDRLGGHVKRFAMSQAGPDIQVRGGGLARKALAATLADASLGGKGNPGERERGREGRRS